MKLLLLSLQSKKLVGPFEKPPIDKQLPTINPPYQQEDLVREILAVEFKQFGTPPYHVEVSSDLREYVAYQLIQKFGAHFYYAFSTDPISKWENCENAILPNGYEKRISAGGDLLDTSLLATKLRYF